MFQSPARSQSSAQASLLRELEALVGEENVLSADGDRQAYVSDTAPSVRKIPAAVRPRTEDEVSAIVGLCRVHRVPLYPISTGHNWGYGTAQPTEDGSLVLDLSQMREITIDEEMGTVTVQPGVTQGQLAEELDRRGLPFMVPTTGAGPSCSLLGNALERGYGLTPNTDHFGAVLSMQAILPDGSAYRGALTELGGEQVDQNFKWGLGPYLDGLFAQGAFGIVTRATIALARRPEAISGVYFWLKDDASLESAVIRIRSLLRDIGANLGSVNLMNDRRMLSMSAPLPEGLKESGGIFADEEVEQLVIKHHITSWTGLGMIYGPKSIVAAAKRIVRRELAPICKRLLFLTEGRISFLKGVAGLLPTRWSKELRATLQLVGDGFALTAGRPNEVAMPLSYLRSGVKPQAGMCDPARDGCGLLWYAPLLPMTPERVRVYVEMVKEVCLAHGIDPLITLTSVSERCFDSTVPLLFDKNSEEASARAERCYQALFARGQAEGFLPYRLGVNHQSLAVKEGSAYFELVSRLKSAIDPEHLIAPGRYSLPPADVRARRQSDIRELGSPRTGTGPRQGAIDQVA